MLDSILYITGKGLMSYLEGNRCFVAYIIVIISNSYFLINEVIGRLDE